MQARSLNPFSYYDAILGAIPIALVLSLGIAAVLDYTMLVAAMLGSAVSVGVIAHALFIRTPVGRAGVSSDPVDEVSPPDGTA